MTDLGTPRPRDGYGGFRLLALVSVSAGLLLLAAAAFVLSYAGVHAVALSTGVSPRLARLYPLIFDAMLVVACAAVLSLRGAGLPSRCYAWLSLLVLLAAVAFADALHATNTALPHRPAAAAVAVIPWALVLIGFGLLLTMLRHARLRRAALSVAGQSAGHGSQAEPAFSAAPAPAPAGEHGAGSDPRQDRGFLTYPEPQPGFEASGDAEPRFEAGGDAAPGFEAGDDAEPGFQAGYESEAMPQSQDEPGHETEPESQAATGPGTAPQFERVRSFPVPPEN
jgi:hypothetical protein